MVDGQAASAQIAVSKFSGLSAMHQPPSQGRLAQLVSLATVL